MISFPYQRLILSSRARIRLADLTNAFLEGLITLQTLLGETNIFTTALRILKEVCTRS